MNDIPASVQIFFVLSLLAAMLCAYFYHRGFEKGRAVGWNEHHFENIERDRARRNRLGQFRSNRQRKEGAV